MSDWEKEIQEKLDSEKAEFPPSWDPEEGDTLIGIIMNIREPTTQRGPTKVWEIKGTWTHAKINKSDVGTWCLWKSTVLRKLDSAPLGSKVGIKYLGLTKGEKGYKYKNYTVEVILP